MIKFKFTEKDTENYKIWFTFYPRIETISPFRLIGEKFGYFDPRPQIRTNVTSLLAVILPFFSLWFLPLSVLFLFRGWGNMYIRLPFDTGRNNEAESPEYGAMTYSSGKFVDELWLVWGKKRKHLELPWHFTWCRNSVLLKDGKTWEHSTTKNRKYFYEDVWKDRLFLQVHPYIYTLKSGEKQEVEATIKVQQTEWRRRFLFFTKYFNRVRNYIDVEFNHEVGEESGSWKGGVIGCSETIKKGETPLETLKRMEKERKF